MCLSPKTGKDRIETITVYPGELIPWLTVGMFAGLRPEEAKRLEWQDIDFRRKHIDLPARKAKGRKRRIIPMESNLIELLMPYRPASGEGKIIQNFRWKFQAFTKAVNYSPWSKDCLRHSYGSYHLAKFENSGKTAEYMGHRSAQMLYDRYREVIKEPAHIERIGGWFQNRQEPAKARRVLVYLDRLFPKIGNDHKLPLWNRDFL